MDSLPPALRRVRFRHKLFRHPVVWSRHRRGRITPADAFLASYPRSGTTWLRFLLFEALTGESAEFGTIRKVVPGIGKHRETLPVLEAGGRIIQTHEPYNYGDRRVVYIVRDARSVAISEHAWQMRLGLNPGSLERFLKDFVLGRSNPWGSWAEHVNYWHQSESAREGHLLLLRYEDLRRETETTFQRILDFLGVEVDNRLMRRAVENNSLEGMQAKEERALQKGWRASVRSTIRFVNTGATTGWKEKLTEDQAHLIERHFGHTLGQLGYPVGSGPSKPSP